MKARIHNGSIWNTQLQLWPVSMLLIWIKTGTPVLLTTIHKNLKVKYPGGYTVFHTHTYSCAWVCMGMWTYCPGHAGVSGNEQADRLASTADITSGLQLGRAEVLRGLRNFLSTDKPEHHIIDRLKERGVVKGSGRHSTLQGRERSVFNQTNIGTVSRATLGRLLRRRGGARMGLSERYDAILSWSWNWNWCAWKKLTCAQNTEPDNTPSILKITALFKEPEHCNEELGWTEPSSYVKHSPFHTLCLSPFSHATKLPVASATTTRTVKHLLHQNL